MARGTVGTGAGQYEPLEVKIQYTLGASRQQTGFALRREGALLATLNDVAQNVSDTLLTTFRALLPFDASVTGIDVVNVVTKEGGSISPAGAAGTAQGAEAPGFLCAVASFKGELRARYGQGRMFLPCIKDAWADRETLVGDGILHLNDFVTAMRAAYVTTASGQQFRLINWHPALPAGRPNGTHPERPAVPASWYDVTSIRLNTLLTSLRSRKQGVGV